MTKGKTGLRRRHLLALITLGLSTDILAQKQKGKPASAGTNGAGGPQSHKIPVQNLNPSTPNAVALGYTSNHQQVDTKRWGKKASDQSGEQRCASCALFKAGDGNFGTCSIFAGKRVAAKGWCNAWTSR